jgi:RNA polymerase sigma-32 factor
MEGRMAAFDAHFDLDSSEEEGASMTAPAAYLAAEGADPAEQIEAEDWEDATTGALQAALAGLDERSRDIIQSRWLADEKATLHTLADRYGVSAERIRQLELGALKKLKGAIAA